MTDVSTLTRRIDQELQVDVKRQKAAWEEVVRTNRERGPRLDRYEQVAKHLIELLKPRLTAFVERFKGVVETKPAIREHTRALTLTFAATIAKVRLTFEVFPNEDVSHIRLECTQEIIPVVVPYDKHSVLDFPLDAVQDDAAVQWFDDRIVAIVKTYMAVVNQDTALREHIKEKLVEDPVTKIRFPKYLASSILERDGHTYYFVDEETRREFDKGIAAKQ
jgi:YHS domain-containing protein